MIKENKYSVQPSPIEVFSETVIIKMPRLMSYRDSKIRFSNPLATEISQILYAVVRTETHLKLVSLNPLPSQQFLIPTYTSKGTYA